MLPLIAAAPLLLAVASWGQYAQDTASPKKDLSGYPQEAGRDYSVYRKKCSTCHQIDDLTKKLKAAPSQNEFWVRKMQAMPSTQIKDRDIQPIFRYLAFENAPRTTQTEGQSPAANAPSAQDVAEGRQFYVAQSCNVCHSIGAEQASGGPPLDSVGRRLSHEQLLNRMKALRSGVDKSMPPLPADTPDEKINTLVEYLQTLQGAK
jgi:mono/diheme cytochrome c family protein